MKRIKKKRIGIGESWEVEVCATHNQMNVKSTLTFMKSEYHDIAYIQDIAHIQLTQTKNSGICSVYR